MSNRCEGQLEQQMRHKESENRRWIAVAICGCAFLLALAFRILVAAFADMP